MTAAVDETTRVPVLLPHLRIDIDADGEFSATLDRATYDVPAEWAGLGREAVPRILQQVAAHLESPMRVDVTDNGHTFTDIITPSTRQEGSPPAAPYAASLSSDVTGPGFTPGEPVAIAIVVAHGRADAHGLARVRLPPALLAAYPGVVVLLGTNSGALATCAGGR